MKKRVAIVMSATSNLTFAMGNVLIGLSRHSPGFVDDVIVYHQGMDQRDKDCLSSIQRCTFFEYSPPKLAGLSETEKIKQYALPSFAIYEIFSLLDTYKHVIYLDCDLLIQRDISGILEYGPIGMHGGRLTIHEAVGAQVPGVPLDQFARNSGVVIVNDDLPNYGALTEQCYDATVKYWDTLVFPDQGVLNLVVAQNQITISDLPLSYNHGKGARRPYSAFIVHTQGGKSKFWNNGTAALMFPEWRRNNDTWLALGGRPYEGPRYYWKLADLAPTQFFNFVKQANDAGLKVPG